MIEVSGLSKRYNDKAVVSNISFSVEEGSTAVLIGPSGCGKSTTLKMINKLIDSDSGSIQFNRNPHLELEISIKVISNKNR